MQNRLLFIFIPFIFACAHLKEARQAYNQSDYQRTIRLCRTYVERDSTDADAWLLLSQTYLELAPGGQYAKTCKNKILKLEKRKAFREKGKD